MRPPRPPVPVQAFDRFDELLRRRPLTPASAGSSRPSSATPSLPPLLPRRHSFDAAPSLLPLTAEVGCDYDWGPDKAVDDAAAEHDAQAGAVGDSEDFAAWAEESRVAALEFKALDAECRGDLARPKLMSPAQQDALFGEARALFEEGQRWSESLWGGLARLRKRMASLAQNAERCAEVGHFQAVAHGIEREFEVFKVQQRQEFQTLTASELELSEESLVVLGRRAEGWIAEASVLGSSSARARGSSAPPAQEGASSGAADGAVTARSFQQLLRAPSADDLAATPRRPGTALLADDPEVAEVRSQLLELDAEIQRSSTGGWTAMEHRIFLRIWQAADMTVGPEVLKKLKVQLPTPKTEEEVLEHVRWSGHVESLLARRRSLVYRWRQRRLDLERSAAAELEETRARDWDRRRQEELRQQQEQEERRSKVEEWRQLRAGRDRQAAIEQELLVQEQARAERDAQASKCADLRDVVEDWRIQRETKRQHAEKQEVAARAEARCLSVENRRRVARRNAEFLRRKLKETPAEVLAGAAPSPRPLRPPSRSRSVDACSRLHEPTHASAQRVVNSRPATAAKVAAVPGAERRRASHAARVRRAAAAVGQTVSGALAEPPPAPRCLIPSASEPPPVPDLRM